MTETENNIETTNEVTASTETVAPEATAKTTDVAVETTPDVIEPMPQTQEGMNWFVLRVASNKEDFVRNAPVSYTHLTLPTILLV